MVSNTVTLGHLTLWEVLEYVINVCFRKKEHVTVSLGSDQCSRGGTIHKVPLRVKERYNKGTA